MADFNIKQVLVEEEASGHAASESILRNLPGVPCRTKETFESKISIDESDMGKERLHLLNFKGEFLKPCPGTKEYICCGYQILNVGTNCPLDCSYCILQSYFNQANLRVFVNIREKLKEVLQLIDINPDQIFRIGTGEFTDSLAIDSIVRWTDLLPPLFSKRKNAVLEFKTKTDNIEGLLASKYRKQIIVSWSLNSHFVSTREEHKAAGLKKRLEAARRCQSEGFVTGFHFDPLISHPHWQEEYLKTLELMDKYLDPNRIIWISLGSFRFMPGLKHIIRKRHKKTCVLDGEFIMGLDGKMRYFKPIRIDLYAFIKEHLEKWHPGLGLYLCMESDDVWRKGLGWSPCNSSGLGKYLDKRVMDFF